MRIVHVYKDFDPPIHGGMERHIALMCRFQRQWAEVEALTCSRSWKTRVATRDGTRVTEVGELGRLQSAPVAPAFLWYLRRMRADVLVIHMPNPTAELGYLLARPPGRLVVRYHSDVVRQAAAMKLYRPFQMKFLKKAGIIIPTSEQYLGSSPALQEVRERCRVVPLGILPEEFHQPDRRHVESLRVAQGGGFAFFCGLHRYYKGLEYLVHAAKDIEGPVVIAGDGPERPRIESLARQVGARVTFPGVLSHQDLVDHLHACDLFVFPSVERSEAFGISILEAQACGKPVVATTLRTGVEYANIHGETGLNVAPRDPVALAEAVNALLADPERRAAMGEAGRRRVAREFHAERVAREEFDLYQELLQ